MQSLVTPGDPGYRPPRISLYDRLFKKNQNQPLDPLDRDKEEFPVERPETNLENYAINDSFNEKPLSMYDEMSDVSSVNSDQIPQEDYKIISRYGKDFKVYPPGKPPMPKTYQGIYEYPIEPPDPNKDYVFLGNRDRAGEGKWYPKTGNIEDFKDDLGEISTDWIKEGKFSNWMDLDKEGRPIPPKTFESLIHNQGLPKETFNSEKELQKVLLQHGQPLSGTREELFKRVIDAREARIPGSYEVAVQRGVQSDEQLAQFKATESLKEASQARLARQNSPQQPYPENWNPQANTSANRAWGAQNIANMEAEMAQEQARISGLGTAPRAAQGAQAAEALPGAAARAGSMATRLGESLSNFSARALPIINLGLLGYGLYNQAKNNRENERHRKMIEGNQI